MIHNKLVAVLSRAKICYMQYNYKVRHAPSWGFKHINIHWQRKGFWFKDFSPAHFLARD
jgi:hypothetical protein